MVARSEVIIAGGSTRSMACGENQQHPVGLTIQDRT